MTFSGARTLREIMGKMAVFERSAYGGVTTVTRNPGRDVPVLVGAPGAPGPPGPMGSYGLRGNKGIYKMKRLLITVWIIPITTCGMRLLLFCVDDDHICQTHKLSYMYWPDSNCYADFIHKQNLRWMLHTKRGKIHEKMPLFILKSVESVLWYSFNCNYCAKRICDNAFVVFLCWKDINCWRNFNDLASKLKYLEPPKRVIHRTVVTRQTYIRWYEEK